MAKTTPVLIYDNLCLSCATYAKMIHHLTKGKMLIVGHYTTQGKELKKQIFPKGYDGFDMSWFVVDNFAYGGRAGLVHLIKYVLFSKKPNSNIPNQFDLHQCTADCSTVKGVFIRSCSIMSHSKKIAIRQ